MMEGMPFMWGGALQGRNFNRMPSPLSAGFIKEQEKAAVNNPQQFILPQLASYIEKYYGIPWDMYMTGLRNTIWPKESNRKVNWRPNIQK